MKAKATKARAKIAARRPPRRAGGTTDKPSPAVAAPEPTVGVTGTFVDRPVAHLLLCLSGRFDEATVGLFTARIEEEVLRTKPKRVLVDLRECSVVLTISDMNDLVKTAARSLAGQVQRLALVLKPGDILPEKFFEPALTRRGVPTLATHAYDEALDWLSAKLQPGL